jgi:hypothetical protein
MGKKKSPLNTSREIRTWYEERWPTGGVYVIPPSEAPPLFYEQCRGLLEKTWRIVVVASGMSGGRADFMFNFLRVEEKERALDQHPAIIQFNGDIPALSGCLLHHAPFPGRTIDLSGEGWATFIANRNGNYYPISGLPGVTSGSITDLSSPSQHEAFRYGVAHRSGCLISGWAR